MWKPTNDDRELDRREKICSLGIFGVTGAILKPTNDERVLDRRGRILSVVFGLAGGLIAVGMIGNAAIRGESADQFHNPHTTISSQAIPLPH